MDVSLILREIDGMSDFYFGVETNGGLRNVRERVLKTAQACQRHNFAHVRLAPRRPL